MRWFSLAGLNRGIHTLRQMPEETQREFDHKLDQINYTRARIFAFILAIIDIPYLLIDIAHWQEGEWIITPGYQWLFWNHALQLLVLLIFIPLFLFWRTPKDKSTLPHQRILWLSMTFFVMLYSSVTSSIDQMIHGQITVYLMGSLGIAAALYTSLPVSIAVYALGFSVFLVGVAWLQPDPAMQLGHYINGSSLLVIAWALSRIMYNNMARDFINRYTIDRQTEELEKAKNRTEDLLVSILPQPVVEELNLKGHSPPQLRQSTTIVFTDFVAFTSFTAQSDARRMIEHLDSIFANFDKIVRKHGLEKLKTIGDGYMYAGGLFTEDNQVGNAVESALEIVEYMKRTQPSLRVLTKYEWSIRVGIHVGPAITGIIGSWRFIYDVWGNTVNVASRLQEESKANRVNVSAAVFDHLKNVQHYHFESRGALPVRSLGPMEMYFLSRRDAITSTAKD